MPHADNQMIDSDSGESCNSPNHDEDTCPICIEAKRYKTVRQCDCGFIWDIETGKEVEDSEWCVIEYMECAECMHEKLVKNLPLQNVSQHRLTTKFELKY